MGISREQYIRNFWSEAAAQNAAALKAYFASDAYIRWNNTNEQFTVDEYIRANCEYPGAWCGAVERIECAGALCISVARVWLADESASFHATSFFEFCGDKIAVLNEYWGEDGAAPQWRREKHIGKPIL